MTGLLKRLDELVLAGVKPDPGEDPEAERLAIGGDWNEPPSSHGRGSPAWIARAIGLRIHVPPVGKHGRIDYAMSDLELRKVVRLPGGKSDHGLILYVLADRERQHKYTIAIWNLEVGRGPALREDMVDFLAQVMRKHRPDAFLLQEASTYHPLLRKLATERDYFFVGSSVRGPWHLVTLVNKFDQHRASRREAPTAVRFKRMARVPWMTKDGKEHTPTYATCCTVDRRLRLINVHEAPSVDWRGGRAEGPRNRVLNRIQSALTLVRIGKRVIANRAGGPKK